MTLVISDVMQLSVSFDYKVFPSLNTSLLKHFVLRVDGN